MTTVKEHKMSKKLAEMVLAYLFCIQSVAMGSRDIIGVRLQQKDRNHSFLHDGEQNLASHQL